MTTNTNEVDLAKLVWSRMTDDERAAAIEHLIEFADNNVMWEAMAVGAANVATRNNGAASLPAPAKRTSPRKATTPTSEGEAPKRRGRPPGTKNKPKDAEPASTATPAAVPNPFEAPVVSFTETLRNS